MAEELILEYVLDQPHVPTSNVETQLKVLMKINASSSLRSGEALQTSSHLVLVLDVSSSMGDQDIRELRVAAKGVVDLLKPGDVLSLIAFQSVVYEVIQAERIGPHTDRDALRQKIDVIEHYRGGGTDMEYAIEKAEHQLNTVPDTRLTRKIILFTDGRVDGIEENCLRKAAEISARGTSFDALGFGSEFDYKFMQRLVGFSSGFTARVERPEQMREVFAERVRDLTNSVANNVKLRLTFTPQVRAGRAYRYSPEMMYLGNIKLPGDKRDIDIPIGTIERDKEYSYLVTFTSPRREVGHARAVKAELFYDVPALDLKGGSSLQSIVVHYTDDPEEAAELHGEVERAFDEVEIGRMVDELEKAMASDEHKRSSMFFDILAKRYTELGDIDMAGHYKKLKQKYMADGHLTQDDMNYTRHKATQKKEGGVQLVDASDLI